MKSAVKIALSLLVGALAGSAFTDYGWRHYFSMLRDAQQLSSTISVEQRSPEIAELELTRLLPYLETAPPLIRTDPREQTIKRFVAYARLARVQQAQGKQPEAQKNFEAALSFLRSAFPDSKAASADDVLLALTTIDGATGKHP